MLLELVAISKYQLSNANVKKERSFVLVETTSTDVNLLNCVHIFTLILNALVWYKQKILKIACECKVSSTSEML